MFWLGVQTAGVHSLLPHFLAYHPLLYGKTHCWMDNEVQNYKFPLWQCNPWCQGDTITLGGDIGGVVSSVAALSPAGIPNIVRKKSLLYAKTQFRKDNEVYLPDFLL
jgi:hypothetical protein